MKPHKLWQAMNTGRLATVEEISECARLLKELSGINVSKIKWHTNILDYYHNQRGGSCNGY